MLPILFAATRPYSHLSKVFKTTTFRPEVILASLYYFFRDFVEEFRRSEKSSCLIGDSVMSALTESLHEMKAK